MRAARSAHYMITRIVFCAACELENLSISILLQSYVFSSILEPITFLRAPFTNTSGLYPSFQVTGQVSHLYETRDKTVVNMYFDYLYCCIVHFVQSFN